jgi:hypothetical protein
MKKILIYIDDLISSEDIIKSLSGLAYIQATQLDITLVKTYLVGCVDADQAVKENDRIKLNNLKILDAHEKVLQEATFGYKLNISKKVKMGAVLNVLPRFVEKNDFDLLIVGSATSDLVNSMSLSARNFSHQFPLIIICPGEEILEKEFV